MATCVGVNDATCRIDEEQPGAETIEGIRECCSFRGLEVDHAADQHRAAYVRHNEPHWLARRIVDEPVALMSEDTEHGGACRRFIERGANKIHQALRLRPLFVNAGFGELVVRKKIGGAYWLTDLRKDVTGRGRVELRVFVEIELL